jgi:hypothetical protein
MTLAAIMVTVDFDPPSKARISLAADLARRRSSANVCFESLVAFREVGTMPTLPPKANIGVQSRGVRFVPKADIKRATRRQLSLLSQRGVDAPYARTSKH